MPLFIVLSGYFSKNINVDKIVRTIRGTWQAFVVMALASLVFLRNKDWHVFITPVSSYWYLLSLVLWRMMLLLCVRIFRNEKCLLLLSFALVPIMMNLLPSSYSEIFSIMKAVSFFPYFIMGYMISDVTFASIRKTRVLWILLGLIAISLICWNSSRFMHEIFWHRKTISAILVEHPYSEWLFWLWEVFSYIAAIVISFVLLSLPKLPKTICELGKYTLVFYVLQDVSWNASKRLVVPGALWLIIPIVVIFCGVYLCKHHHEKIVTFPISSLVERFKNGTKR